MKDLRPALRALLLADATVSAAIGGARLYPSRLPQGQRLASVVYNRIAGGAGDYHHQGASGLVVTIIQVDSWAVDPDAASILACKVRDRLEGFAGVVPYGDGSPPQGTVTIQGVFITAQRDDYDSEAELYRESLEARVHWEADGA